MNNQEIIKYIKTKKAVAIYKYKEQEIQDTEIRNLYNKGYFNPQEYAQYTLRQLTYQTMINRFSSRMNDDYYYYYVDDFYAEGYLSYDDFEFYLWAFNEFYYAGTMDYDLYIQALELTLQTINYNILHGGGGSGGDDPEPDYPDYPEEPEE